METYITAMIDGGIPDFRQTNDHWQQTSQEIRLKKPMLVDSRVDTYQSKSHPENHIRFAFKELPVQKYTIFLIIDSD